MAQNVARGTLFMAMLSFAAHAQAQAPDLLTVTPTVRDVSGCYRLSARPWSEGPRGWGRPPALPTIVRLDTVPQRVLGRDPDFRASPDVTSYHEFAFAPGWRLRNDGQLLISWWDAYAGPVLLLRREGAEWQGTGTYVEHNGSGLVPTATVRVAKMACPVDGAL